MFNAFRFLRALLNTANAGPVAGSPNARPVIEPPPGARPAGRAKPKDGDGDEPAGDDDEDDEEDADAADGDGDGDADADGDTDGDADGDDADADGDDDDDDGTDPDADLDADTDDGKDDELDEDTESLRESVEARLEALPERDPTFGADGVTLDFTKTKMTADKRALLKKKLLAGIEDPTAEETARAEAYIEALEEQSQTTAVELLSQYHNVAIKPVATQTFLASRERANGKRLSEFKEKLGARYTPEVDAALGELYSGLVKKYGFVRADTVPFTRLFRMLPRKMRDASRTSAANGGKPTKESKAERTARREREDALAAAGAPRAIGRVSPKAGKPDKGNSPEAKNQRAVAETIRQGGGKFF